MNFEASREKAIDKLNNFELVQGKYYNSFKKDKKQSLFYEKGLF